MNRTSAFSSTANARTPRIRIRILGNPAAEPPPGGSLKKTAEAFLLASAVNFLKILNFAGVHFTKRQPCHRHRNANNCPPRGVHYRLVSVNILRLLCLFFSFRKLCRSSRKCSRRSHRCVYQRVHHTHRSSDPYYYRSKSLRRK